MAEPDFTFMYMGDRWTKPNALREGDYIWLPMTFNGNIPIVNYYQDWDLNLEAGTWRPFNGNRSLAKRRTATASSVSGANTAINVTDQGRSFKIQISSDASAWTDVYGTTAGPRRSVTDVAFTRATARYVRMYGTQRGGSNGYSLFDFMVLNDDSESDPISHRSQPAPSMPALSWYNGVLSYSLPFASRAKLEAIDMRGKSLGIFFDGYQGAGRHEAAFFGKAEAGPYLFRLQAGGKSLLIARTGLPD